MEQGAAAAHQDQHVAVAVGRAGRPRRPCRRPPSPRVDHRLDRRAAMRRASCLVALSAGSASTGRPRRRAPRRRRSRSSGQRSTQPRVRSRRAAWRWRGELPPGRRPAGALGVGEHRVDEAPAPPASSASSPAAARCSNGRPAPSITRAVALASRQRSRSGARALEGVDRLLLVADREHGAVRRARRAPGADEELAGQGAQDVPLVGRGVLRLVEQHVVDAAVELEQHPGRVGALGQQRVRSARSGRRSRAPAAPSWRRRRAPT